MFLSLAALLVLVLVLRVYVPVRTSDCCALPRPLARPLARSLLLCLRL